MVSDKDVPILNKIDMTDEDIIDIQHILHFIDTNTPVSGHGISDSRNKQLRDKLAEVTGVRLEEQHPELFTSEYKLNHPELFSDIKHNCSKNLWYNDYDWVDEKNLVVTAVCEICGEKFKETMERISFEKVEG